MPRTPHTNSCKEMTEYKELLNTEKLIIGDVVIYNPKYVGIKIDHKKRWNVLAIGVPDGKCNLDLLNPSYNFYSHSHSGSFDGRVFVSDVFIEKNDEIHISCIGNGALTFVSK